MVKASTFLMVKELYLHFSANETQIASFINVISTSYVLDGGGASVCQSLTSSITSTPVKQEERRQAAGDACVRSASRRRGNVMQSGFYSFYSNNDGP